MTYEASVVIHGRRGRKIAAVRRFKYLRLAYWWVRVAAWWVDSKTPTHFRATYQDGSPYLETTDLDITWHVTEAAE